MKITRRFAQVRPPLRDDVNDMVKSEPNPPALAIANHTRPSGVTRGNEPLSPIPRLCVSTRLGTDQFVWVPFRRACAYDTNTRSPASLVPIAQETYTRPKYLLRGLVSIAIHCLSKTWAPLNGVRRIKSGAPLCVAIHDAGVVAPRGRTATAIPERGSIGLTSGERKKWSPVLR